MDILSIVISLFVLLFAITIHEASHAWSALKMGDPTAYAAGRVSLNPLAHIDPIGTVILPIILVLMHAPAFGWAKPVPVNPYNLRHPRRDNLWISLAGPAANLTAALSAIILIRILRALAPGITTFLQGFILLRQPFPRGFYPLEGLALVLFYFVLINTYLAVFNMIPVPPLDGSGILSGLLSDRAAAAYDRIRPYGFIIVLALVSLGFLDIVIQPILLLIKVIVFF
ncbi:MAG: site-2 protease family protein [Candidatus Aminicenantales bacterium]